MKSVGYIYTRTHESYKQYDACKLGETINIPDRDSLYATGEIKRGHFDNVYEISFGGQTEVETLLKNEFKSWHIKFDGGSEFFNRKIIPLIEPCLKKNKIEYRILSRDEINILSRSKRFAHIIQKPIVAKHISQMIINFRDKRQLEKKFYTTFLPNKTPRRIQTELWHIFKQICDEEKKYRGIVQWATGTGKTIATLILFVLSATAHIKKGKIFRGLMIAPKNDIFDTIIHHIRKLSNWDIVIYEGHNAQLSSLQIPIDKHVLITATHASLTDAQQWLKLPPITHCHYDEVHRITGDMFYNALQENLEKWDTQYLTGTSATPKTCITSQHNKIAELFGNPLNILHKCDVDEAIAEGWIAQPRFGVNVIPKGMSKNDTIHAVINIVQKSIADKQSQKKWRGGKVIVYMPLRIDICQAVIVAKEIMPEAKIYTAVEHAEASDDDMFVSDESDGTPRILFACERYREGSDIHGLEMTVVLMGETIGANIIVQIAGRALRQDYEGKEGWCIIVRPSEDGTHEDDVFDSIMFQIVDFIGQGSNPSQSKVRQLVEKYFGQMAISGKVYDVEETVRRIQTFYARKAFEHATPKEKYEVVRDLNCEMMIQTKDQYNQKSDVHIKFIENPRFYFKDHWVSWYHFFGINTSAYPQTKTEWMQKCKELGILRWQDYKETHKKNNLPENPGEMYEDYTNWDREVGTEDDYVW
jgi:superfamily II DNA or RNA helicase